MLEYSPTLNSLVWRSEREKKKKLFSLDYNREKERNVDFKERESDE